MLRLHPKITIWVNFGGSCNARLYCHLVYFTAIWYMYFVAIGYILWLFGVYVYFSRFGMLCQENLATLLYITFSERSHRRFLD
jgi:hypothetical protein